MIHQNPTESVGCQTSGRYSSCISLPCINQNSSRQPLNKSDGMFDVVPTLFPRCYQAYYLSPDTSQHSSFCKELLNLGGGRHELRRKAHEDCIPS